MSITETDALFRPQKGRSAGGLETLAVGDLHGDPVAREPAAVPVGPHARDLDADRRVDVGGLDRRGDRRVPTAWRFAGRFGDADDRGGRGTRRLLTTNGHRGARGGSGSVWTSDARRCDEVGAVPAAPR